MYVFRIHIRPNGGTADTKTTFHYCVEQGVLGVGWRLPEYRHITDWAEYEALAAPVHDNLSTCQYIARWVGAGDLIWTRDTEGQYYLAKALSGWEYWQSQYAIDNDIDIANVFRCELRKVDIDNVPGKVVACFRPARTIQVIADPQAIEYSKHLWNRLSGTSDYVVNVGGIADIFTMLDDEETEDLVFLYLQTLGWYVVPNSRKADTMSYEYLLVNPISAQRALVQVKTGEVSLDVADYAGLTEQVFLFQANERYIGNSSDGVRCISRKEMLDFLDRSLPWLPGIFKKKLDLISASRVASAAA